MPDYWWFEGVSVAALANYLTEAKNPRLEVRVDAEQKMTFRVIGDTRSAVGPDINDSLICPPICP